jgi:hypothetical protein
MGLKNNSNIIGRLILIRRNTVRFPHGNEQLSEMMGRHDICISQTTLYPCKMFHKGTIILSIKCCNK